MTRMTRVMRLIWGRIESSELTPHFIRRFRNHDVTYSLSPCSFALLEEEIKPSLLFAFSYLRLVLFELLEPSVKLLVLGLANWFLHLRVHRHTQGVCVV
jgi:hypothetical protein